jgi:hypothetical protein
MLKTVIEFVFCDIPNYQGLAVSVIGFAFGSTDNTDRDLDKSRTYLYKINVVSWLYFIYCTLKYRHSIWFTDFNILVPEIHAPLEQMLSQRKKQL